MHYFADQINSGIALLIVRLQSRRQDLVRTAVGSTESVEAEKHDAQRAPPSAKARCRVRNPSIVSCSVEEILSGVGDASFVADKGAGLCRRGAADCVDALNSSGLRKKSVIAG